MKINFTDFDKHDWHASVDALESEIRSELHGGLIKDFRDSFDKERTRQLSQLRDEFYKTVDIENIDEQLNEYTLGIKKINSHIQHFVNFNLVNHIESNLHSMEILYPTTAAVVRYITDKSKTTAGANRIQAILNKVVVDSTIQSNKSNAGKAGEEFVEVMLNAIGLKENEHYKKQHKSRSFSDTDFVFPFVEDYKDNRVQMYAAVQFSSNDRFRMVGGELKSGANAVAISGNGFSASSKNLDAIGAKILSGMIEKNHQLVCYGAEINRKINALEKQLLETKSDGTPKKHAADQKVKLEFYKDYAMSFSDFCKELRSRFL